ncbi:MAG TPA: hypothetical protein VK760_12885 [Candidatus Acidoferrales bacterium]|jgi:hypothetical protein|nr:hypothetical protein [Candidatus Acidoferrales bacterium]
MLSKSALILICTALALPLAARADAVPDSATQALTADYKLNCTAATDPTDANLAAAFGLLAPDFVSVDFKGKQTQHDEFIASAKQQIKLLHITTCDNTLTSVTASDPNTIVVVVTGKLAGQLQAPDGSHDFDLTSKTQDTWKLNNGTWQNSQGKELSSLVKIDGKVVQDEGN